MDKDIKKAFMWGIGCALCGLAIAWLLGLVKWQETEQKDTLLELHQAELTACIEAGKNCRIEYLKDRDDTIYGAKVVEVDE